MINKKAKSFEWFCKIILSNIWWIMSLISVFSKLKTFLSRNKDIKVNFNLWHIFCAISSLMKAYSKASISIKSWIMIFRSSKNRFIFLMKDLQWNSLKMLCWKFREQISIIFFAFSKKIVSFSIQHRKWLKHFCCYYRYQRLKNYHWSKRWFVDWAFFVLSNYRFNY